MSSFARSALLWVAAVAVKGRDELAAVGLDGPSRQPKEHQISGQRRTLDMNYQHNPPDTGWPFHGRPKRSFRRALLFLSSGWMVGKQELIRPAMAESCFLICQEARHRALISAELGADQNP
jgi:hypothetical protein